MKDNRSKTCTVYIYCAKASTQSFTEKKKSSKVSRKSLSSKTAGGVVKPKKTSPFKGERLGASYYFHEVCGGKIGRCTPHIIPEKDGRRKLKEIKLVRQVWQASQSGSCKARLETSQTRALEYCTLHAER